MMKSGELGRLRAEARAEAIKERGMPPTTDLEVLRSRTAGQRDERRRIEHEVEIDIAKRRRLVRAHERLQYVHLVQVPPRRTDMTYWKTKLSGPDKSITPEECKATRDKTITHARYENSVFRTHAKHGFVYWMRKDQTLNMSKPSSTIRTDKLHFHSCNSLGAMKPDWGGVRF